MTLYKKIHLIQETLKVNFHAIYKHDKIFSKLKVSPKKMILNVAMRIHQLIK